MPRVRPICSLVFILAFCVPSQLRGDDVLCIENTGRIGLGCAEMIDVPRYVGGQGVCSPPDCAPCTDVQINWSTSEPVVNLAPPANSPTGPAILLTEHLVVPPLEAPTSLLDIGPCAILVFTSSSLRC